MLNKFRKPRKFKKSEKGMAIIEAIPALFMMVVFFNFSLGFFGAIHSGILNSIASYNYTMETFRFRSNLMYFRPGAGGDANYSKAMNRIHGTIQDGSEETAGDNRTVNKWPATMRGITFNYKPGDPKRDLSSITTGKNDPRAAVTDNADRTFKITPDAQNVWSRKSDYTPQEGDPIQTTRVWIKTVYGICLSAECTK